MAKTMRIVALNPPYFPMFSRASRSPAVTKSSTLYYPFFLAYATGVLEDDGFEVMLLDAPAEGLSREDTLARVAQFKPAMVICETSTPSIDNDMEVVSELKRSGVPFIVAVGTHVSALPEETLSACGYLDAVARHEYEYTVRDCARALKANGPQAGLQGIPGLSLRREGGIVHNPDRPFIDDLDALPFVSRVYRDHLRKNLKAYFYGANLHPVAAILSGRGCPHRCAYCVYPQTMTGNRYRLRSVQSVLAELAFIRKEIPEVREVFIEDDTLTVDRQRVRCLSQAIIDSGLKVLWSTNSRADVDFETMHLMRRAGCRLLCVGFESGSQQILNAIGKNIKLSLYERFVNDARRAGLLIHGCFMYGNDGETPETMEETLALAKRLGCDSAQFFPIMVYPGTRAYDLFKQKKRITARAYRQWLTEDGMHNCVVSLPGISAGELVAFCDKSRREFYLRPAYMFAKILQVATQPRECKRLVRASWALKNHLFARTKKR